MDSFETVCATHTEFKELIITTTTLKGNRLRRCRLQILTEFTIYEHTLRTAGLKVHLDFDDLQRSWTACLESARRASAKDLEGEHRAIVFILEDCGKLLKIDRKLE